MARREENNQEFQERVVNIDRVARVVKGGRRFRFRALVVIGDGKGQVGMGISKASDVTSAVAKAVSQAKKHLIHVPITNTGTIPHEITSRFSGAKVFLKPAGPGTGVIAGGAIREVLEASGVSDILSKSLGSSNKLNTTYATIEALKQLRSFEKEKKTEKAKAGSK